MSDSGRQNKYNSESQQTTDGNLPDSKAHRATMQPGDVVELNTTKGIISFVLFEKDCPNTTKRIKSLVSQGKYNGVGFPRVEDWIIQTDEATIPESGIPLEAVDGLTHAKGAVGMDRKGNDYSSGNSVFYILKDPMPGLDGDYTVFGRLIYGMDVVMKITKNDSIKSARLRPFTKKDKIALEEKLQIETERLTE